MYATANISGGHINPAVTLASMISGHIHWKRGLLYMLAQFLGAIFGALLQVSAIASPVASWPCLQPTPTPAPRFLNL